jgi:L-amino acid N-acyltransferase YncA
MNEPLIRPLDEADLPAVLAIHNDAVLTQSSIWIDEPTTLAERDGILLGFASYGEFRSSRAIASRSGIRSMRRGPLGGTASELCFCNS